ncbi:uncharacterized protein MELLADRAFT_118110 [Melampsora larici-populina 98AG31]|uniref:Tetraspanin n=1 Tax=Melampsora larici-populina (strain 98AG31 / pathotype 3-4-7) TaxID=747676 RepID=F4S575_MELLP|nr:uncharacterized protein MELLADRAFT_118110 [Melampsora larici-populina 98AG31]EGG00209.1 hypothetical protein MELLADRAFT_118110 [Melampsora larici-populina 98AG31]
MKLAALTRYTYIFIFFDIALLAAAIFTLLIVLRWKHLLHSAPLPNRHLITRLTLSTNFVHAGHIFSIATFIAFIISLWPLLTRPTRDNAATRPVAIHMLFILFVFLLTMGAATTIWFTTLRIRSLFTPVWIEQPLNIKLYLQDSLQCCGWFNATAAGLFEPELRTGFCSDPETIPKDPDPNVSIGCVGPFTNKADDLFNNTFTTLYGFTILELGLFLTAACIANLRIQKKRFLRIDYKLITGGKGGFV